MAEPAAWHILTGEYPPQPGGVSDYCRVVAAALAARGVPVHVWCPPAAAPTPEDRGVAIHRVAGRWSPADLARLGAALDRFPAPRRLLVQYVPKAWGYRGANLGFCRWLVRRRRRGDLVRVVVHEVAQPWKLRDRPRRWLLAAANRLMIRRVLAASTRLDLAMAGWEARLRPYARALPPTSVQPVPSTLPVADDPPGVAALRRRLAPGGELVLGTFATYGWSTEAPLRAALPPLLAGRPDRLGLLLGRGGERFAAALAAACPALAGRLIAPGELDPEALSRHLQACDLMLLPYQDGVSTRRTTMMAALAHGLPAVTNSGPSTDPSWAASGATALAPGANPAGLVRAAERLLADPQARARLGATARAVYAERFAPERVVAALLEEDAAPAAPGPR